MTIVAAPRRTERKTGREVLAVACGAHALHDGFTDVLYLLLPIWQAGPPGWPAAFVPTGVAVGRSGVIYFASDLDCAIYRLTPLQGAGR